jgi:hypothetical protein
MKHETLTSPRQKVHEMVLEGDEKQHDTALVLNATDEKENIKLLEN